MQCSDHSFVCATIELDRAQQKIINQFIQRMPKLLNREVTGEVKCILEIRGVISRHVSAPWVCATGEQKAEFQRLIEETDLLMESP